MTFKIDHVTFAWSWLQTLAGEFGKIDLAPEYGGIHSNGVTHMSMLGFDDGSYVELVSVRQPGLQAPRWRDQVNSDGGASAWAVDSDDIEAAAARLRSRGVSVDGPHHVQRIRPDGVVVEWDLAVIGDHDAGVMHPFIIKDRSPRGNRVTASASVTGTELVGVDTVVLAVPDVEATAESFQQVYGLSAPESFDCREFPGPLLAFPGEPLVLAGPGSPGDWIAARLDAYGPTPCGFLIGSRDLARSRERFSLSEDGGFGERAFGWLDGEVMRNLHLGIVEAREGR